MRPQDIIGELEALASHYMRPVRSPEEHSRWLADYVEDLKGFPGEAVTVACRAWRSNGENQRVPTPGQLAALARSHIRRAGSTPDAIRPWMPMEPDQIGQMSLSDQIRYHKIAASEATKRAPPMWSGGRPVTEAQMPADRAEKRRFFLARAGDHWAEVNRLSAILARHDRRA